MDDIEASLSLRLGKSKHSKNLSQKFSDSLTDKHTYLVSNPNTTNGIQNQEYKPQENKTDPNCFVHDFISFIFIWMYFG